MHSTSILSKNSNVHLYGAPQLSTIRRWSVRIIRSTTRMSSKSLRSLEQDFEAKPVYTLKLKIRR